MSLHIYHYVSSKLFQLVYVVTTLICFFASQLSYAFEDLDEVFDTDEMIFTSTKSAKTVYRVPAVASVIGQGQITASAATDLAELLEQVAGIHVYPSPYNRMTSSFSVRGMHTRMNPELLFLVNGAQFKYLFTSALPHLMRIPLHGIERIEIIKGPGSALYGADAYSGVINIITKTGASLEGPEAGLRLGSFDSSNAWLQFGVDIDEKTSVGVFIEQIKSDGDRSRIIEQDALGAAPFAETPGPVSSRFDEQELRINVQRGDLDLHWWHYEVIEAGTGVGAAQVLDENGFSETRSDHISFNYDNDNISDLFSLELSGFYHRLKDSTNFIIYPPGFPFGPIILEDGLIGNPGAEDRQYELAVHLVSKGWQNHVTRVGVGYHLTDFHPTESKNFPPGTAPGELTDVTGTDAVFSRDLERNNRYFLVQDEWLLFPDWELTWGFRYDYYNDFGGTFNPRLALVYSATLESTVKLLYGSAFREPAVDELTSRNNPVAMGNPELDPQTIDTYELAYTYHSLSDRVLQVSGYYYQARDMIDFFPQAGTTSLVAQGEMDRDGYGFEIEGSLKITESLTGKANVAWQRSVVKENATIAEVRKEVWGTPEKQAYLQLHWEPLSKFSILVDAHWVADRLRDDGDSRDQISDYWLTNLAMRLNTVGGKINYEFNIKNLFDEEILEPSDGQIPGDYPMPSRALWFGMNVKF